MAGRGGMKAAVLVVALCGCGSSAPEPLTGKWEAGADVVELARDACLHETDVRMALHGYPRRPKADTPHFKYRHQYFSDCMHDKGFDADD